MTKTASVRVLITAWLVWWMAVGVIHERQEPEEVAVHRTVRAATVLPDKTPTPTPLPTPRAIQVVPPVSSSTEVKAEHVHAVPIPKDAVAQQIAKYWPGDDRKALAVAWCESNWKPTARNGVHVGLFQLSGRYHQGRAAKLGYSWEEVATQIEPNVKTAWSLRKDSGWGPWDCGYATKIP